MSRPFRRRRTEPIPDGAKITTRRGKLTAKWADADGAHASSVIEVEKGKHRGERRILIASEQYFGSYTDGDGRQRRAALGSDIEAAETELKRLTDQGLRERRGIDCAAERREQEPIDQHIQAFVAVLKATGNQSPKRGRRVRKPVTDEHAKTVERHIRTIVTGCGFSTPIEINADDVDEFMDGLALGAVTKNKYLTNVRAFVTWCVARKRLTSDVLAGAFYFDEDGAEHRDRAALTPEQAQKLIDATLRRPVELARFYVGPKGQRVTDEDRRRMGFRNALAWKTFIYAGLRANELRNVRWADIDLDRGWLTVRAETCKTRQSRDVALRADHVADLRRWREMCGDIDPEAIAIRLRHRTSQLIQSDLAFAGIAYRDDDGRYRDVHALRYVCNTWLREAGVPDFIIKRHLGHSTSGDMTETYTDARLIDMHAEVEKLPALTIPGLSASRSMTAAG